MYFVNRGSGDEGGAGSGGKTVGAEDRVVHPEGAARVASLRCPQECASSFGMEIARQASHALVDMTSPGSYRLVLPGTLLETIVSLDSRARAKRILRVIGTRKEIAG